MTATNEKNGYPKNWKQISLKVRARAKGQCECTGHCALHRGRRCEEQDKEQAKWANGKVMLTVAHLNHFPADCRMTNLLAMCNRCHLRYDLNLHKRSMEETRKRKELTMLLPLDQH